jgi:PAS domain S-box-containing protein
MQQESAVNWIKLDFEHARAKHFLFKARLRSLLYGADIDESSVVSHLDCTVGQWIYSRGLSTYGDIPEMHQLEKVHKQLHAEAGKLVHLYKAGKVEPARKGLPLAEKLADNLNDLLTTIEQKVQQSGRWLNGEEGVADALAVNLSELQELLRLNEGLDQRIKEQSKALYLSKERFELVAKATQDAIWDWDLAANELWWNDGYKALFGYNDEDMDSHLDSWSRCIHPDDRQRVVDSINKVIANGDTLWETEYRFRRKDGSYALVLDRAYALKDEKGQICRMLGSMQDISRRKQTEEALRLSEERLKKVLSIDTVGVIYFDFEGNIHDANEAFLRMCGYSKQQLLSGEVRWTVLTPPEFMEASLKSKEEFLTIGQNTPYEKQYIRPDGSRWWGLFAGKRLSETEAVEFVVDITATKEIEKQLEQKVRERTKDLESLNHQLRLTNTNLEEFAYAASHDLKEPVRKIHLFADRLRQELKDVLNETQVQFFERMERSAQRMSILIDDLLTYSHVSRGVMLHETVDLNKKVKNVLEDLELEIEEKKARIDIERLPVISGHKRQLQQLFQNLIGNALKYSKPDAPPHITIRSRLITGDEIPVLLTSEDSGKQFYLIQVADNGIGFDPGDAERIFNVFTRLHGNAEYKGTGVGLSIAQKVVQNHGGYIWAESKLGEGATFNVLLPVEKHTG